METEPEPRIATVERQTLPINCPVCSEPLAVLGEKDHLPDDAAWISGSESRGIETFIAESGGDGPELLTRTVERLNCACPSCGAALSALRIRFIRAPRQGVPQHAASWRLQFALHGDAYIGWAMSEYRLDNGDIVEHLFMPVLADRFEKSMRSVLGIADDLPRMIGESD